VIITADEGLRGGKRIPLKKTVDGALCIAGTECVKHVLVVRQRAATSAALRGLTAVRYALSLYE
jgi:acyl-coenzyme A synthetase/AMP-(fatty) acid ligase